MSQDVEDAGSACGESGDASSLDNITTLEKIKATSLPEAHVLMKLLFNMVVQVSKDKWMQ